MIFAGTPLWAINLRNACKKARAVNSKAISKCIALVVKHVNRTIQNFCLFPSILHIDGPR
ncbi:unnamed protein product [Meloidogyne enterolobii]|uniref:Uncharacterized protein n=1 Tax=Meloidogyne enterolobii TaxID=390850 RepID=A0ACB0YDU1_MELEN